MKARVTQTDIARVAGVHNTTVSLSLSNSRLIPPATRQRIQTIAKAMGYCPDPALRALVAYRNSSRKQRRVETLAYVTNGETKWGWSNLPAHKMYYAAARRRAAELGYQIEHLWLGEPGMSPRRLDGMLLNRGISGVVFASARASCDELTDINWSRISAVKIGCFPHTPALHQLTVDPNEVVRVAMRHILFSGYQRVGLVISQHWDKLTGHAWSAAFHAEQYRCHLKAALPVLCLRDSMEEQSLTGEALGFSVYDTESLVRWYQQYKPEAIIGLAPTVLGHIKRSGLRVPEEVAYVDLRLRDSGDAIAGVWENSERIGELAVEMLANQLQQNILGIPTVATVTSVAATWRKGDSLPARPLPSVREMEPAGPAALNRSLVA